MPFRISASLRLCAILLAAPLAADEPLTWKWAEGDSARYQMTQKMQMTMDAGPAGKVSTATRNDTIMLWSVDSVEDGVATLRQKTERVVMENKGPMGQGFSYDSDDGDPPAGMAALVAPMFEALVENDFLLKMLKTGEITEVVLTDELSEALDRLPGGAVSGDMVAQMSKQGSLRFPAEPLAVGDEWTTDIEINTPQMGPMKVSTTYTYDGPRDVEGREFEAFTPKISLTAGGDGKQAMPIQIETKDSTGEILFDREAGRIYRSRVLQTMNVRVTVGGQEVVNEVEQAVEMRSLAESEAPVFAEEPEASMAE